MTTPSAMSSPLAGLALLVGRPTLADVPASRAGSRTGRSPGTSTTTMTCRARPPPATFRTWTIAADPRLDRQRDRSRHVARARSPGRRRQRARRGPVFDVVLRAQSRAGHERGRRRSGSCRGAATPAVSHHQGQGLGRDPGLPGRRRRGAKVQRQDRPARRGRADERARDDWRADLPCRRLQRPGRVHRRLRARRHRRGRARQLPLYHVQPRPLTRDRVLGADGQRGPPSRRPLARGRRALDWRPHPGRLRHARSARR